jgi:threonine synthase
MKYISTRGQAPVKNFTDVVTSGLASDGGLYVPEKIPTFPLSEIQSWKNLSYAELATKIISPFVDGEIPEADLFKIISNGTKKFREPQVTKIVKLEDGLHVLELFHGPTLAFKDVALQFLGQLQDYILSKLNKDIVIIGATSGDTGSAAIEGVKDCKHIKLFMLHPHGKISNIQRRQMTSVISPNIHNLAVDSYFDDCQDMVKEMFKHPEFMHGVPLSAVNSINWARIVAQIVYYVQASLQLNGATKPLSFAVPSGNLGDIFAGYIAKLMGLPVDKLIVTTNENDILHRFFESNDYSRHSVKQTLAPSMDIQISSNFERLLFFVHDYDGEKINRKMIKFREENILEVSADKHAEITKTFKSMESTDAEIREEIKRVYEKYGYLVCPHTATATRAAEKFKDVESDVVVLATAHPAKFPDVAIEELDIHPQLPEHLKDLLEKPEKVTRMPNDIEQLKEFIYKNSIN